MQEHIYSVKKSKIFSQTWPIGLFVLAFIVANIFMISMAIETTQYWTIPVIDVILGLLTIPGVILFKNYLHYSLNKEFIVTYESLKIIDKKSKEVIELKSKEIVQVELHQSSSDSKLPWCDLSYVCFIDSSGKKIIVTSFIMNLKDFWLDTLTRRVSSDKLIRKEGYYPVIKN